MAPDLAFINVLACAVGVAGILFIIGRLFFPDIMPSPASRRIIQPLLFLLIFLPPLTGSFPAWSRDFALGGLVGLLLAVATGLTMLACLLHLRLRTRQLRERIAVHRHLTRHRRPEPRSAPMKYLLALLLLCGLPALQAAPDVQFDCTIVSTPKPMNLGGLPDQKPYYAELRAKGSPIPRDMILVSGIFTPGQTAALLETFRRARAEIITLPAWVVPSNRTSTIDTLKKGPPSVQVLGDFARYRIKPVKIQSGPPSDIGFRISCRPTVDPDGTIDCHFKYRSCLLKGFDETLLTGSSFAALRTASVQARPDFPRIRQPLYTTQEVTTELTLYDGQTVLFTLRDKDADPTVPFYEYALISVRLVK